MPLSSPCHAVSVPLSPMPKGWWAKAGLPISSNGTTAMAATRRVRGEAENVFKSRSSSVMVLAGVLTDAGGAGALQLRDSDGFSPFFPRFHQRLIPAETRQTNLGECTAVDPLSWA